MSKLLGGMSTLPADFAELSQAQGLGKVFRVTRLPMMIVRANGDICALNDATLSIFNMKAGDIDNVNGMVQGEDPKLLNHIQGAMCSTQPVPIRTMLQVGETEVDCQCIVRRLDVDDNGPVALVEITKSEEYLIPFHALNTQLEELQRALEGETRSRIETENAYKAKADFVSIVSHEIRTPLNGILGLTELMASADLPEQESKDIQTMLKAGKALVELLNGVLDFSRIDTGNVEICVEEVCMFDLVTSLHALWRPSAMKKGIELRLCCGENVPAQSLFDLNRVRQCVNNLISNAIKFTDSGYVEIHVSATETDDSNHQICIQVQDTGIGIQQENLDRVFEPFVQVDESYARSSSGTGLGLSITRRLARLMGGEVTAKSVIGHGTTFVMEFEAQAAYAEPQSLGTRAG